MDRNGLEEKINILLRDISNLSDQDKKKYIADFIEREICKENDTFYIDRFDLTNIQSFAADSWHSLPLDKKVNGQKLDQKGIQTLMFFRAVVGFLRGKHLLHRIVKLKFDDE